MAGGALLTQIQNGGEGGSHTRRQLQPVQGTNHPHSSWREGIAAQKNKDGVGSNQWSACGNVCLWYGRDGRFVKMVGYMLSTTEQSWSTTGEKRSRWPEVEGARPPTSRKGNGIESRAALPRGTVSGALLQNELSHTGHELVEVDQARLVCVNFFKYSVEFLQKGETRAA